MASHQEKTEQTRALALLFVKIGSTRTLDQLADMFIPEAKWNIAVDETLSGYYGGSMPAVEVFISAMIKLATFEEYSFEAQKIICEGDSALIDVACHGKGPGPVDYHQNYAFILTTSEGKIADLKVWSDPFQVKAWMDKWAKYQEVLAGKDTSANL